MSKRTKEDTQNLKGGVGEVYENQAKNRGIGPKEKDDFDSHLEELLADERFRQVWERREPRRELAKAVLRRRSQLGLSQRDLAEKMGTSQSYIYSLESGEANPRVETLEKLAAALELTLDIQLGTSLDERLIGTARELEQVTESSQSNVPQATVTLGAQQEVSVNEAAEKFAEAVRESYQMVADRAVSAQQLNAELTQNFFNSVINNLRSQAESNWHITQELQGQQERQREATQALTRESIGAYMDFVNSMFSYYQGTVEQAGRQAQQAQRKALQ